MPCNQIVGRWVLHCVSGECLLATLSPASGQSGSGDFSTLEKRTLVRMHHEEEPSLGSGTDGCIAVFHSCRKITWMGTTCPVFPYLSGRLPSLSVPDSTAVVFPRVLFLYQQGDVRVEACVLGLDVTRTKADHIYCYHQ